MFICFYENSCIEINAERAQILTSQNYGQDGRCSSSHMYNYLLRKRMGHNGTKRYKDYKEITKRSKGNNRLKLQRSAASATDHNSGPGMMRHSFQFPSSSSAAATMISLSDHPSRLSCRSASPSCSKSSQLRAHPKTRWNWFALGLLWGKCSHQTCDKRKGLSLQFPCRLPKQF